MRFYKKNAYPDIFLHDCQFRLEYKDQTLRLLFEDGFCRMTADCSANPERIKGYIQIENIPSDEISIKAYKGKRCFGKYTETVHNIDLELLSCLLKNCCLEVIDEYYCSGQVLYKCGFYPYQKKRPFDRVEIVISYYDSTLDYYISDDSGPACD